MIQFGKDPKNTTRKGLRIPARKLKMTLITKTVIKSGIAARSPETIRFRIVSNKDLDCFWSFRFISNSSNISLG
jgi:hypothetical protein